MWLRTSTENTYTCALKKRNEQCEYLKGVSKGPVPVRLCQQNKQTNKQRD